MITAALSHHERRQWGIAAIGALVAHLLLAALVLAWARTPAPPMVEPVMIVELPAEGSATAAPAPQTAEQQPQPPQPQLAAVRRPIEAPRISAPLPREVVDVPPPAPVQQSAAPVAPPPIAPAAAVPATAAPARDVVGPGTSSTPGDSTKAKQQEVDYFSQISAYLNRRKNYPVEARKARQQGVVVIRFTVDRMGNVSDVSIKRGSGNDTLDTATLDLLRRVAPLPKMPASMQRDSVTLSLPIDYSLRTV